MVKLELPALYTLADIDQALNGAGRPTKIVTRRTLEGIVRELGFGRGRGRCRLFSREEALEIYEAVKCRRSVRKPVSSTTSRAIAAQLRSEQRKRRPR